jgi:hypothetical protein
MFSHILNKHAPSKNKTGHKHGRPNPIPADTSVGRRGCCGWRRRSRSASSRRRCRRLRNTGRTIPMVVVRDTFCWTSRCWMWFRGRRRGWLWHTRRTVPMVVMRDALVVVIVWGRTSRFRDSRRTIPVVIVSYAFVGVWRSRMSAGRRRHGWWRLMGVLRLRRRRRGGLGDTWWTVPVVLMGYTSGGTSRCRMRVG